MHKKTVLKYGAILLSVLLVVFTALEITNTINIFGSKSTSRESPVETRANADKKEAIINEGPADENDNEKSSSSGTYTPPTDPDKIVFISRQDGDQVILTTQLYGYSDGECRLMISRGTSEYTNTAPIMYQSDYATCAGFTVPKSAVGIGMWTINLTVAAGDSVLTKKAELEVR